MKSTNNFFTVWLTRPKDLQQQLVKKLLNYKNIKIIEQPLINIRPIKHPSQNINLKNYNFNPVTVSKTSSQLAYKFLLKRNIPVNNLIWLTVGPYSAEILFNLGVKNVIYPATPPFGSEGLLKTLQNYQLKFSRNIIFQSSHNDSRLEKYLNPSQAVILYDIKKMVINKSINYQAIDIIIIYCGSSLEALAKKKLHIKPSCLLFVISLRLYKIAKSYGFKNIKFLPDFESRPIDNSNIFKI